MTPRRASRRKGSVAFAAIREAVLQAVARIPPGQVLEVAALGASLNIPARHAAYVLARLTPDEADLVPSHRVVPAGGMFGDPRRWSARIARQVALLRDEGHAVLPTGRMLCEPDRFWQPDGRHRETVWADFDART